MVKRFMPFVFKWKFVTILFSKASNQKDQYCIALFKHYFAPFLGVFLCLKMQLTIIVKWSVMNLNTPLTDWSFIWQKKTPPICTNKINLFKIWWDRNHITCLYCLLFKVRKNIKQSMKTVFNNQTTSLYSSIKKYYMTPHVLSCRCLLRNRIIL